MTDVLVSLSIVDEFGCHVYFTVAHSMVLYSGLENIVSDVLIWLPVSTFFCSP